MKVLQIITFYLITSLIFQVFWLQNTFQSLQVSRGGNGNKTKLHHEVSGNLRVLGEFEIKDRCQI